MAYGLVVTEYSVGGVPF